MAWGLLLVSNNQFRFGLHDDHITVWSLIICLHLQIRALEDVQVPCDSICLLHPELGTIWVF